MTYIRLDQGHTDDARWIEAGADAFALHVAALVYCDRTLSDGCISRAMALRVSLAVPPDKAGAAVDVLVSHGFWQEVATGYVIVGYDQHAFPAEQIKRTRKRWQQDKERRRQHDHGDHSLCKDPKFCPAIRSTVESGMESTGGRSHLYPTQPNQTKPEGFGDGKGDAQAGAAGAPPAGLKPHPFDFGAALDSALEDGAEECCPLPPEHPIHIGWVIDGETRHQPPGQIKPHPYNYDEDCCPLGNDHAIHAGQGWIDDGKTYAETGVSA